MASPGVQPPGSAEPSATPQQLPLSEAAAGPTLPPGSSPLSPSLRYAAVAQESEYRTDDGDQPAALLPAAPLLPSVEGALVQPAAATTPAAGTALGQPPASGPGRAAAAVARKSPEAAVPQPIAAAAAATSPDPFRPTAASGFQPFTPVAARPDQQQQQPPPDAPAATQPEVELAPEEPASASSSPGAPLAVEPVAACSFETICHTPMSGAAATPGQQHIAVSSDTKCDAPAAATPVQTTPAASTAAPLHDSASSQALAGGPTTELAAAVSTVAPLPAAAPLPDSTSTHFAAAEPVTELAAAVPAAAALPNSTSTQMPAVEPVAELAAAPVTARKLAVSFADPAAVADCTVSGAWSTSPPALAATGGAAMAALAATYSPPCAAATQEPRPLPPSAMRTPQAAAPSCGPGIMPVSAVWQDALCSMERISVSSNVAFEATPAGARAASLHGNAQVCKEIGSERVVSAQQHASHCR